MATPITHIVLTEKVRKKLFPDKDPAKFYIGVTYPDIRHLVPEYPTLVRFYTHTNANFNLIRYLFKVGSLNIDKAQKAGDFAAGKAFHSVVDSAIRDKLVGPELEERGINGVDLRVFKLLSDEILYDRVKNWNEIAGYYGQILPQEINFVFGEDKVLRWHQILGDYFKHKPNKESRLDFGKGVGFSESMINKVEQLVTGYKKDPKIIQYIENLYENLEKYLELS